MKYKCPACGKEYDTDHIQIYDGSEELKLKCWCGQFDYLSYIPGKNIDSYIKLITVNDRELCCRAVNGVAVASILNLDQEISKWKYINSDKKLVLIQDTCKSSKIQMKIDTSFSGGMMSVKGVGLGKLSSESDVNGSISDDKDDSIILAITLIDDTIMHINYTNISYWDMSKLQSDIDNMSIPDTSGYLMYICPKCHDKSYSVKNVDDDFLTCHLCDNEYKGSRGQPSNKNCYLYDRLRKTISDRISKLKNIDYKWPVAVYNRRILLLKFSKISYNIIITHIICDINGIVDNQFTFHLFDDDITSIKTYPKPDRVGRITTIVNTFWYWFYRLIGILIPIGIFIFVLYLLWLLLKLVGIFFILCIITILIICGKLLK